MAKDIGGISSRIWGSDIPENIKAKLRSRQDLARGMHPGQSLDDVLPDNFRSYTTNFDGQYDLSSRTPWARMWTSVSLTNFVTIKKHTNIVDDDDYKNIDKTSGLEYFYDSTEETVYEKEAQRDAIQIYSVGNNVFNQFYYPDENGSLNDNWFTQRGIPTGENSDTANEVAKSIQSEPMYDNLRGRFNEYGPSNNRSGPDEYFGDPYSNFQGLTGLAKDLFPTELSNQNNAFMQPPAGILSLSSQTEGFGAIKRTKVQFKIFNWNDYENIYSKYFLRPGALLFVDFGWDTSTVYNPAHLINGLETDKSKSVAEYLYGTEGVVTEGMGDMDVLIGNVVDYEAKLADDGTVDCNVELISQNGQLLSYDLDQWEEIRRDIVNNLELDLINHAAKSVQYSSGKAEWNHEEATQILADGDPDDIASWTAAAEAWGNAYLAPKVTNATKGTWGSIPEIAVKTGALFMPTSYGDTEADAISNNKNIYISWGLFEDFVLNYSFANGDANSLDDVINSDDNSAVPTKFDSRASFVIFDELLLQRQKHHTSPTDLTYILPDNWDDSYSRFMGLYDKRQYQEAVKNNANSKNAKYATVGKPLNRRQIQYCLAEWEYATHGTQSYYWRYDPDWWWMGSRGDLNEQENLDQKIRYTKWIGIRSDKNEEYTNNYDGSDTGCTPDPLPPDWKTTYYGKNVIIGDGYSSWYKTSGFVGPDWEKCYAVDNIKWLASVNEMKEGTKHNNAGIAHTSGVGVADEMLDNFIGWTWMDQDANGDMSKGSNVWPLTAPYNGEKPTAYFGIDDSRDGCHNMYRQLYLQNSSFAKYFHPPTPWLGVTNAKSIVAGTIHDWGSIMYDNVLFNDGDVIEPEVEIQFANPAGLEPGIKYKCATMTRKAVRPHTSLRVSSPYKYLMSEKQSGKHRWKPGFRLVQEVQTTTVEKEFTKHDKGQNRIPLREIFIQVHAIKRAFLDAETTGEAVSKIIADMNETSDGMMDLQLTSVDYENKEMAVIDRNYVSSITNDSSGQEFGKLFEFRLNDKSSFVKAFDINFGMPSSDYGSMIALQGMSGGQMFPVNDVIDWTLSMKGLDDMTESGKTLMDYQITYLPHPQRFRAKQIQDIHASYKPSKPDSIFGNSAQLQQKLYSGKKVIGARTDASAETLDNTITLAKKRNLDSLENSGFTIQNQDEDIQESLSATKKISITRTTADSPEQLFLQQAKQKHFLSFKSTIMPVELTLDIYGISSFITGDLVKIDHIPRRFASRVYFQVTSIDHELDNSGWTTTLGTVMRMKNDSAFKRKTGLFTTATKVFLSKDSVKKEAKDCKGAEPYEGQIPWSNMSQLEPYFERTNNVNSYGHALKVWKFKWTGGTQYYAQRPTIMWPNRNSSKQFNSGARKAFGGQNNKYRESDDGKAFIVWGEGIATMGFGYPNPTKMDDFNKWNIPKDGKTKGIVPILQKAPKPTTGTVRLPGTVEGFVFTKFMHIGKDEAAKKKQFGQGAAWTLFYTKLEKGKMYHLVTLGDAFVVIPASSSAQVRRGTKNWLEACDTGGTVWTQMTDSAPSGDWIPADWFTKLSANSGEGIKKISPEKNE